jgi:cyclopropane fatty-acyl-phospholipid synthase-like methyltransferase
MNKLPSPARDLIHDLVLERYLKSITDGMTVAEIGCGQGKTLKALITKYPGIRLIGLDASVESLELACDYCYPSPVDLRLITSVFPLQTATTQYVYSYGLLKHCQWEQIVYAFKECSRILTDEGIMMHDFLPVQSMNGLYYYSHHQIQELAAYIKFEIVSYDTGFYIFKRNLVL